MAIVEVVKYNGKPDVFAWKYPSEELGTWTQLIVNESQEAVLFKGGKALDVFTSGRHTLDTANIPLLNKVVNLPFGGRSPFTAEVWYVNRVNSLDVKWGTATPIQLQEINAYLDELSAYMKERIEPVMAEYGITLVNFYVNDINIPEDDPAVRKLKAALAKRAEMDIIGYNYQQERSFDTLEGAATNQGSAASGLMGAGLGLGMGVAAGGAVGGQFGGMANVLDTAAPGGECPQCHARVPAGKKFCPDCGCSLTKGGPEKGEEISCASCGTALNQKTKFCPECGKKYNPCPNCGADLPEGAGACAKCGADVPTLCPSCGKTIAEKKAKFCPECGARLQRTCPKCGKEVDGKQKFCPECGEKLKEGE